MNQSESSMHLSLASVELPSARRVDEWLSDLSDPDVHKSTSVIQLVPILFSELGIDSQALIDKDYVTSMLSPQASYLDAEKAPQHVLARTSMTRLVEKREGDRGLKDCDLLIYSHTAVDEEPVHSTVCWLASEFKLSRTPYFSVAQLQGTCLFQAIDVACGFFNSDPDMQSAMLVTGEKWPLPYPRVLPHGVVLSDGAVSLWFDRNSNTPCLEVRDSLLRCVDLFGDVFQLEQRTEQELSAMSSVAAENIRALLDKHQLDISDISVVAHAGLNYKMNQQLENQLLVTSDTVIVQAPAEYGYLSAVQAPYVLALVLEMVAAGRFEQDALVLVWGIGLGGSVGAMLLGVCNQ